MKKIITMVGTSLFENYIEKNDDTNFKNAYNHLKNNKINAQNLDSESQRRKNIEKGLDRTWFEKHKQNVSAEIKSLIKLKEELNEDFEIHLLYSDTALSRLAAEILQKAITQYYDEFKDCEVKIIEIPKLQIWDKREFMEGMSNLIKKVDEISKGSWENVIINITGGYKATIPYLTILGQINRCPIYYIFEDTDALIKISPTPISINWGIFEKYSHILEKFEKGIDQLNEFKKDYSEYDQFYEELKSLIWIDNQLQLAELNPIGKIFWQLYQKNIIVYIPTQSQYFKLPQPHKRRIENAVRELYGRLKTFLKNEKNKSSCIKKIINLTDQNDLRHGPVIDEEEGVFIFKSTNETHIRLLYSFNLSPIGEVTSIIIYDFVYEKFDHSKYIEQFKRNYPIIKDREKTILPVKKEVSHV
ncbi:putative CRISPR-associated protein [Thermodesulfovibrio sp. 3462-1]|uniref:CRISPR-associated protein n=1 Tax=Thermodesulfovibrio obliviosus TaxID=3118332 RepID=A0AAU8H3A1_9BACT